MDGEASADNDIARGEREDPKLKNSGQESSQAMDHGLAEC